MPDILIASSVSRWVEERGRRSHVLRGINLRVVEGEMAAIYARPGAGTTELLSILGGLRRPDRGLVWLAGHNLNEMGEAERETLLRETVGWVLQRPRLAPLLTAEENVAIVLQALHREGDDAGRSAWTALEAVGLRERAARPAGALSEAERALVAVAGALAKAPALVIADQPTAHLDPEAAQRVSALLRDAADSGAAVLVATRDAALTAWAHRALVMDQGVLVEAQRVA